VSAIRILIADDHPVFRFGLRMLLESESDLEVVGEAGSGEDALAKTEALQPDVVLMDINLPGINGVEATQRILQARPRTGVLMVTMLDDNSLLAALRAGARGYLLKGAAADETLRAIRAVAHGEAIFSPAIAQRLSKAVGAPPPAAQTQPPFPALTAREREILAYIARGVSNAGIAEQLSLSLKTVRNHVSSILDKLQVSDRLQAGLRARDAGLGRDNQAQ
jgi:DNA-binding NarL/FixJ family response regulator